MIDPIIDEIHRTRREISNKSHGDFTAMLDDARKRKKRPDGQFGNQILRTRWSSGMVYHPLILMLPD